MSQITTLKQHKHLKPTLNQALIVVACYLSVLDRQQMPSYAMNMPVSNPSYQERQVSYIPAALQQNIGPTFYSRFDTRKPIWNMAHMVNSIKELDYRLEKGANAVETDIKFSKDGDPLYTYHGVPCDCWRHCHQQEELPQFLRYARDITSDDTSEIGQNFTLLLLDLKLYSLKPKAKEKAGVELARSLVDNLFASSIEIEAPARENSISMPPRRGTHLKVVLSVNHVTDVELISYFIHQLTMMNSSHLLVDRIGFDVGMNDDIDLIESMWRRFKMPLNLWQGDGYTNCFSPFYSALRLSKALVKRDSAYGYPKKVYQWSIDLHDRLRESLLLGVDAVMTNYPERLATILAEPAIADHFRLATRADDPFRKIHFRSSYRTAPGGALASNGIRYQRSTNLPGGGVMSTLMDTFSSCLNYLWEIPSFSLPTTSRFLSSNSKRHKQSSLSLAKSDTAPDTTSVTGSSTATNSTTTTTEATTTTPDSTTVNSTTTTTSEEGRSATAANYTETTPVNLGPTFDGPRWYTSLASNLLVSAMKLAMPEESS